MGQINSEEILSSEISSYEELLAKSLQLQGRVKETQASLEAAYSGIINAKHVFEEIKRISKSCGYSGKQSLARRPKLPRPSSI